MVMTDPRVEQDLNLITALYRTTNAIVRELDQRLSRDHGITFIQAITLLALDSFDRPQPHLVADYLSQQSQTVTGVLDRLERAGHIGRKRDLEDRRAVRLELTASGARLVRGVRSTLEKHIAEVMSGLSSPDGSKLDSGLQALEQSVRQAGRN